MNRQPRQPRSEPPTVPPPFDPERFARESEHKLGAPVDSTPPSARPTARPTDALVPSIDRSGEVPVLAMARDDLEWFEMSPAARELVRHINGRDELGVVAARTSMPIDDVAAELDSLARENVITWR